MTGPRKLYVKFVGEEPSWTIALDETHAPVTCETLWNALEKPMRARSFHAMFAGPEVMTGLPESAQTFDPNGIPSENQTCFPGAGECLWYYQGANSMKGLTDELWEIGIFYDHGGRTFGPLGWTPVNIFGRIEGDLEGFANACRDLRISGAKDIEIGRR